MRFSTAELSSIYYSSLLPGKTCTQILSAGQPRAAHSNPYGNTLAEHDLDHEMVAVLPQSKSLPHWTRTLNQYLATASQQPSSPTTDVRTVALAAHPRPFEDILMPFIENARHELQARTGGNYLLFTEAAHMMLERSLLFWLADINAQPMQLEFAALRGNSRSALKSPEESSGKRASDAGYRYFIAGMRAGGLKAYLQEYAVLGRLMATFADQWVAMAAEMINRFRNDESLIAAVFNNGAAPGRVTEIQPDCSDRHHEGRSVMILTLESGSRLVYKPRDICLEQAYVDLAVWLNETGAPHTFKTFKVLPRTGYGWAEFMPAIPIPDEAGARDYYQRAGSLLCLVHVLGATDLHLENIIGHGAYPVLIDLETLMHPFARDSATDSPTARHKASRLLHESVIRTGMLPRWYTDETDQAYDVSMLGAGIKQELILEWIQWKDVNTDDMVAGKEKLNMFGPQEIPSETGFICTDFGAEMIRGFRDTYRFFLQRRQSILQQDCWNALSGQSIRFVFRATDTYARILRSLRHPRFLKNGEDRSRYLDKLYKGVETGDDAPVWRPLIALEQEAMDRMDVPHFTTRTDVTSLLPGQKEEISGYFQATAFQNACARLVQMDEHDMEQQIRLIAGTLSCRNSVQPHSDALPARKPLKHGSSLLTPDVALEQGRSIAAALSASAICGADGSVTWISPRLIAGAGKYQLDPIPHDLYAGDSGIALFFAAMYRLTGLSEYKTTTAAIFRTMMQYLEGDGVDHYMPGTVGGFSGRGGLAYCLIKAHILTGDTDLGSAAVKAAARITKSMIDEDKAFDLMYGTAGAILGLAVLYELRPDPDCLDILTYAGDHLLQHRQPTPSGHRAWSTATGAFLTGYSHGAAGIAQALLRLFRITGEERFKAAALDAIAWENSVFDGKEKNWPDFRGAPGPNGERKYMSAWCHGAAGIGLARLEALGICPSSALEADIRNAIATTRRSINAGTDYLCCGNFGRLELLLSAAHQLSDPTLQQEALAGAGMLVHQATNGGGYRYNPALGFTPTFFQGLSGIGYQLLRMTHPDEIPAVLTLS